MSTTRVSLLLLLCFSLMPLHANEVFMSRDANGNLIFSDRPSQDSTSHFVQELPSVPAFRTPQVDTPNKPKPTEEATYTSLSIIHPQDEHSLPVGAAGNVLVHGVLTPNLHANHRIVLLNGATLVAQGRQTQFQLNNLDRGEHTLQIQVRDADNNVIMASQTVRVYVQRASRLSR